MATSNNYVVGKGKLYFQPFQIGLRIPIVGAGFRYFGNTPTLETTRASTGLDHMDSDNGIKQIDDSIDIESKLTGKFSTDNVNGDNLGLWFGGVKFDTTQAAGGSALTEKLTGALPGNFYQIGVTKGDPTGLRGAAMGAVTMGAGAGTALVNGVDYTYDSRTGMFGLIDGGAVTSLGSDVNLTYTTSAGFQQVVIENGQAIFGALKFIANNPKGANRDYFWPYVKLTADGSFALKGDTWQTMSFNFEAMALDSLTRRQYIDLQAVA